MDRQRNRYQRQRDQQTKRDRDRHRQRDRDKKILFATQAPTYFIITYVSKNVYSSRAKSILPFSKHRSRDALRTGLVAITSRQKVSERRSLEQGENGSAGCWPQKIHPHTQLLQAQAKTRSTRKHPGCKQSRTNFAQNTKESVKGGRLSKVRTDPRAVGLKRSIHTHTQLLQAQAKTRSTRKHPGCKQSRTDFAQNIGKNTTGRNNRPRLTASRIAKISEN